MLAATQAAPGATVTRMTRREFLAEQRARWIEMHSPNRPLIAFDPFMALFSVALVAVIIGLILDRSAIVVPGSVLIVALSGALAAGVSRSTGPIE